MQPVLAVPPSAAAQRFTEILTLEGGALLGAVLFLGGLAGLIYADLMGPQRIGPGVPVHSEPPFRAA